MNTLSGNQFFFIRHGETDWNVKKLCQGQIDIPLSQRGREETMKFAQSLHDFSIDCIVTSPLKRAFETAQILHKVHPRASLHTVDDFMERNWGELQGQGHLPMFAVEKEEQDNPDFIPKLGIEPRSVVKRRVLKALELSFSHSQNPVIVSHGMLFFVLCDALGLTLAQNIPNLALIEITRHSGKWQLKIL